MDPFDVEFLLRALPCGATVVGAAADARFTGVATDSRAVRPGDLFVALAGERHDGNLFVEDALARGAAGAIARTGCEFRARPDRTVVLVADPLRALGALAGEYRRRLRARVVAVTGSSGKTTTRDLILQALGGDGAGVVAAERSFNNALGVPLTIFRAGRETRTLVLEVGTSGPGEVASLGRIARPDVAVVTNVGAAHLEGLRSIEGVAREKGALVEALAAHGVAVLNADDGRVLAMRARLREGRGALLFGTSGAARVRGVIAPEGSEAVRLEVSVAGGPPIVVRLPFPGRHNGANALAALAAVHALGGDVAEAAARLERARLPGRRLEPVAVGPFTVLDDAYNANPASTAAAIEVLAGLPGRRVLVFGGMRELGPERERLHREVGALAARADLAVFVAVGEDAAIALDAARAEGLPAERGLVAEDPESAADALLPELRPGDRILVKGSRAAKLERFIERLRERVERQAAA